MITVSSFTKNVMFWCCGLLLGIYWGTDPSAFMVGVSILISSIVCAAIDHFVIAKEEQ